MGGDLMKKFHKLMAFVLAAALSVSGLSVTAFAEAVAATEETVTIEETVIPEETVEPAAETEPVIGTETEEVTGTEIVTVTEPVTETEIVMETEEVNETEAVTETETETEAAAVEASEVEAEPEEVLLEAVARINVEEAEVSGISDQTYTGKAYKPKPVVTYYDLTLEEGTDYELSYANNTNAGTASVIITGVGNNDGKKEITFKILPLAIKPVIELSKTTFIYNGKAQQPNQSMITVKNGSEILPSSAYSVSYSAGRKAAGLYYVYVTMKGNYAGKASKAYRINYKAPVITETANTRTGAWIRWEKVSGAKKYCIQRKTLNNSTGEWSEKWTRLAETTATSYTDKNVTSGNIYKYEVHCITEDGKTASGYKPKNNKYLASPKIKAVKNMNAGLKVTWSTVRGADKYVVFRKFGNGDWVKIRTTYGTAFTDQSAKNGKRYKYAVRAASETGTFRSQSSPLKVGVRVSRPVISGVSSPKKRTIKVTWTKNSQATGYLIQISTNSVFTADVKSFVVKGIYNTDTISGLKSKKQYYVRMRTYKTVGGVNYYSTWSVRKSVKTK